MHLQENISFSDFIPQSSAPVIEIFQPINALVDLGSSITVTAKVTGYPTPEITWEDQEGLPLTSEVNVIEPSSLFLLLPLHCALLS